MLSQGEKSPGTVPRVIYPGIMSQGDKIYAPTTMVHQDNIPGEKLTLMIKFTATSKFNHNIKVVNHHHCTIRNHLTITLLRHWIKHRGDTTDYEVDQKKPDITQVRCPILIRISIIGVLKKNQGD